MIELDELESVSENKSLSSQRKRVALSAGVDNITSNGADLTVHDGDVSIISDLAGRHPCNTEVSTKIHPMFLK